MAFPYTVYRLVTEESYNISLKKRPSEQEILNDNHDIPSELKNVWAAAVAGDAAAQSELASRYLSGNMLSKDENRAVFWLKLASAGGDANAQTNYGVALQNGLDFKCKVVDLDYSTFGNCRNLTAVSVASSIGVCFKSLLQDVSMRYIDRNRIESDLEMIESIDNFSGTPIKRKIYDPKSKDLSTIDISEEQIDLDGDTIETIEIVSENELRFKMENHLLRIKLSWEGLYFNSAGFLPPKEDMNTYVGNKALKCYVTDGYDLHSYYYHEIEQKLKSDRSEILPELHKVVIEQIVIHVRYYYITHTMIGLVMNLSTLKSIWITILLLIFLFEKVFF